MIRKCRYTPHPNLCIYLTNIGHTLFWQCPLSSLPHPCLECDPLHHWKAATLSLSITSPGPSIFWPTLAVCQIIKPFCSFSRACIFQKTFKRPRWQWILMSTPSTSRSPRRPGSGATGSQPWRAARTCAPPPSPTSATSTPPSWRRCPGQTPGSRMSSAALRQETLIYHF